MLDIKMNGKGLISVVVIEAGSEMTGISFMVQIMKRITYDWDL